MKRPTLYSSFVLGVLAFACTAPAQEPAKAQSSATPLAPVQVQAAPYNISASLGSLDGTSIHDSPVSIRVIDRQQLDDLQARSLSEVMRADASADDNYAPAGYYQNLSIRGFPLDLATGYRINGLSMAGEQLIAMEDKHSVQVLKGLAGIEAGVVAPGGLVNYVTKRPAEVRQITLATDARGTRHAALDIGTWLTPDLGIRFNTAWENAHRYVDHADGRRNFYALAVDWNMTDTTTLQLDSNYQTSAQRSVSGYQLLGGTELPQHPHNTWMLGYQPWQKPVGIRSANTTARFTWQFSNDWKLRVAAGHSRSVIDDNVAFAYGCFYVEACADGSNPGNFFAPDGQYDIYDYRNPDDTRRNSEGRAILNGEIYVGPVHHTLSVGLDARRRTVDQRLDVNEYVGSAHIDQREPPVFTPSPSQPGPLARRLTNWQRSLLAQDRMRFGDRWQVLVGTRFVRVNENAYDKQGAPERHTRLSQSLPQAALLWLPTAAVTTYLSYSESLSLGQEAPFWTSNDGQILPPMLSRQVETGVKLRANDDLDLSVALFRMHRPYQFAQPDDTEAGYSFVQQGQAVQSGVELGAHGQVTQNFRLDASGAWIRARTQDTGTPSYEGHQTVNVPEFRLSMLGDYQLSAVPGLNLLGGMRYSSANTATADDATRTPAYTLFDAGLRYQSELRGHEMTWHLMVSNLFNRFYWRDTGSAYGDHYLFPGAPREARLSVNWDF